MSDSKPEQETTAAPVAPAAETSTDATAPAAEDKNGTAEKADNGVEASTTQEPSEDAVNGDAKDPAATEDAPAEGTLSSLKRTPSSARRKSGGVPEHKSKKLNKKKSMPQLNLSVSPGDLFLARFKGHAPWPSIICDEDMLPQALKTSRPVTTALPDGTYKKPEYADGGKRAHERTYPIMFLHTNEFAWIVNSDLTKVTPEECGEAEPKGKSKSLVEAYKVAAEGHDLAYFKGLLDDHAAAVEADEAAYQEAEAEKEAERARKAEKKERRKSTAVTEDTDAMDVDEEGGDTKPKSKKRKKDETDTEQTPKTPKTATKLNLKGPKTPASEPKTKTPKIKLSAKEKKEETPAKAEQMEVEQEEVLTPAEKMERKEKEIKYFRHKLQKGLLNRDQQPSEDEMRILETFLKKLETHEDLEAEIIRNTKIHKVLRAMLKLHAIPLDQELNIRDRSMALLKIWNATLEKAGPGGDAADKDDDDKKEDAKPADEVPATATNGESSAAPAPATETKAEPAAAADAEKPAESSTAKIDDDWVQVEKPTDAEVPAPAASEKPAETPTAAPTEESKPVEATS